MTRFNRWSLVALGVVLLLGVPLLVRARPVSDSDLSAAALLARVRASDDAGWSGRVESLGNLDLPVTDNFTEVGALFGDRTTLRAWWRSADQWRVDKTATTGETDLVHDARVTRRWRYESNRLVVSRDPDIRLPRSSDVLPPVLARRVLADVSAAEATRIGAERVAGHDALGLRVRPAAEQSSIDHVDLWADRATGIVLRVEVVAKGESTPSFTSAFTQFTGRRPSVTRTSFLRPPGVRVRFERTLDIADAANRFANVRPPRSLAGLALSPSATGGVGIYGTGVTQVIAVPLWDRAAEPLREQLARTPGVVAADEGQVLQNGPLGLILTDAPGYAGNWLVAGTVDRATLLRAAQQLDGRVQAA